MKNCLINISAFDNIGRYMPENITDQIIKLGCRDLHLTRTLKGVFLFAYIAVIDKGKLEYEKFGKENETVIEYQYKDIKIVSSRYSSLLLRYTAIYYRGYDMSVIERGFNILTLDKDSGDPLDVVLIDCSEEKCFLDP